MSEERLKQLEVAIAQIEKQYGKGSIMRLGSRDVMVPVSVISTGSLSLDAALGVGGLPRGRVVEIFGPESSGKTTLALHVAAQAQKAGGQVAFIDAEHALDPAYARKLGVDVDNLLVSQPDNGEQAIEIAGCLDRVLAAEVADDALLGLAVLANGFDQIQIAVGADSLLAHEHGIGIPYSATKSTTIVIQTLLFSTTPLEKICRPKIKSHQINDLRSRGRPTHAETVKVGLGRAPGCG